MIAASSSGDGNFAHGIAIFVDDNGQLVAWNLVLDMELNAQYAPAEDRSFTSWLRLPRAETHLKSILNGALLPSVCSGPKKGKKKRKKEKSGQLARCFSYYLIFWESRSCLLMDPCCSIVHYFVFPVTLTNTEFYFPYQCCMRILALEYGKFHTNTRTMSTHTNTKWYPKTLEEGQKAKDYFRLHKGSPDTHRGFDFGIRKDITKFTWILKSYFNCISKGWISSNLFPHWLGRLISMRAVNFGFPNKGYAWIPML